MRRYFSSDFVWSGSSDHWTVRMDFLHPAPTAIYEIVALRWNLKVKKYPQPRLERAFESRCWLTSTLLKYYTPLTVGINGSGPLQMVTKQVRLFLCDVFYELILTLHLTRACDRQKAALRMKVYRWPTTQNSTDVSSCSSAHTFGERPGSFRTLHNMICKMWRETRWSGRARCTFSCCRMWWVKICFSIWPEVL